MKSIIKLNRQLFIHDSHLLWNWGFLVVLMCVQFLWISCWPEYSAKVQTPTQIRRYWRFWPIHRNYFFNILRCPQNKFCNWFNNNLLLILTLIGVLLGVALGFGLKELDLDKLDIQYVKFPGTMLLQGPDSKLRFWIWFSYVVEILSG